MQTMGFLAIVGGLGVSLLWVFGDGLARYFSNPALLEHRTALAIYTFCLLSSFPLEMSLTSQGKTRASAICYLVSDTMRALAMVVPVLLGYGLGGMMYSAAGFAFARMVVAYVVLLKGSEGQLWDWKLFRQQLAYAAPFGAAMALSIPQQYAHQYAVSGIVSPEMFALYAVGCFQLPIVDLLYTPTSEVLMVRIGELEKSGHLNEALLSFREAASRLAYAFLPMSAFLFAAAPEFIGALFGQKFLPAVPMFRVSVVGVALAILPMDGVLRARNQTRHIFLSYMVKALVTAPLVYFGVKRFGMMGGIGSWALAEVFGKATLLVRVPAALSTPERRLKLRDVIPWLAICKALGAAGAAAMAVFALRVVSAHAFVGMPAGFVWRAIPLAVAGLLFGVGYLAVLWVAGVRPLSLLLAMRRRRTA